MDRLSTKLRALSGLVFVASAMLVSVASSPATDGDGVCGALFTDGAAEGETCAAREDCNEVCCLCDNGDFGFVAQGCDLDNGSCYGGDVVCQLALADDPDLCGSGAETDGGP